MCFAPQGRALFEHLGSLTSKLPSNDGNLNKNILENIINIMEPNIEIQRTTIGTFSINHGQPSYVQINLGIHISYRASANVHVKSICDLQEILPLTGVPGSQPYLPPGKWRTRDGTPAGLRAQRWDRQRW